MMAWPAPCAVAIPLMSTVATPTLSDSHLETEVRSDVLPSE
jgi:hypothetical protein